MRCGNEWHFYLDDMIGFTEKVITYTEGFNQTDFINSGLTYDATVRNLELIGEAPRIFPKKCVKPTRKSRGGN